MFHRDTPISGNINGTNGLGACMCRYVNLKNGIRNAWVGCSSPRADEWIDAAIKKLVGGPQSPLNETALSDVHFAEITRRGLLELQRRQLARLDGNYGNAFFDSAFDPGRMPDTTFGELAKQYLDVTEEECAVNCTSQKWVDKQKANMALLKEIIGANTHLRQVDYDVCLRVRGVLARLPSNRSKLYAGLSIEEAIAASQAAGNPTFCGRSTWRGDDRRSGRY